MNQTIAKEPLELFFFKTPAYGYLEVPVDLLQQLGIDQEISSDSQKYKGFRYLKEEADAPLFIETIEKVQVLVKITSITDPEVFDKLTLGLQIDTLFGDRKCFLLELGSCEY